MNKYVQKVGMVFGFAILLGVVTGTRSEARVLGNPTVDLGKGNMDVGLGVGTVAKEFDATVPLPIFGTVKGTETDFVSHTGFFFDYGLTDTGALRLELAQVKFGIGSASGTEYGASYRMNLGTRKLASGKTMTFGGLAGFQSGSLSGDNFGVSYSGSYTDYQVAGGASLAVQKGFNAYLAAIIDEMSGSISNSGSKFKFSSNDPVGVYGGVDYELTPEFKIGGEYHLIFETGWAVYGSFKF